MQLLQVAVSAAHAYAARILFLAGSDDHHHELGALIGLQMWRAALSTSVYFSGAIQRAH